MACTTRTSITGSLSRICDREPAASSHLNKGAEVHLSAVAIVLRTDSNRTEPDRILGLIGGGSGALALGAALSTLIVFPYRTASIQERVWFTLRLAGLFALFGMGLVSDECAQHALSVDAIRTCPNRFRASGHLAPLSPLASEGGWGDFTGAGFLEAPTFLRSFGASERPNSPCGRRELGRSYRGRFFWEAPAFLRSFWASERPDSPFSPCGRRGQGG